MGHETRTGGVALASRLPVVRDSLSPTPTWCSNLIGQGEVSRSIGAGAECVGALCVAPLGSGPGEGISTAIPSGPRHRGTLKTSY